MKTISIITAMLVFTGATAAFGGATCHPTDPNCNTTSPPTNGISTIIPLIFSSPPGPPPTSYKATCETDNGFGLMAFSSNAALVNLIRARLAAGRTVMADVDGTQVTRVSSRGAVRVTDVVQGPDGRMVICYKSY